MVEQEKKTKATVETVETEVVESEQDEVLYDNDINDCGLEQTHRRKLSIDFELEHANTLKRNELQK